MKNSNENSKKTSQAKIKNIKKLTKDILLPVANDVQKYCYSGYDIFFIHGWSCATLSAIGAVNDESALPLYFILNENMIPEDSDSIDSEFDKFTNQLFAIYEQLATAIFEENKLIKPLINLNSPNIFTPDNLTSIELLNLHHWLYGYLSGYLIVSEDIQDHCTDENLLSKLFYPALFTICAAFWLLDQQMKVIDNQNDYSDKFNHYPEYLKEFYIDFCDDLDNMWESDEIDELNQHNSVKLSEATKNLSLSDVLPKIIESVNAIFSVAVCIEASNSSKH